MKIETIQKEHLITMSEAKVGNVIVPKYYPEDDYYLKIYMDTDFYTINKDYADDLDLKNTITAISLKSGKVVLFFPEEECKLCDAKIVIERDV